MKDLRKEISKAFYDSAFKGLKVNYQLQCDASHSSKLPVRVRDSEDEDSKSYQMIPGGQMIPKGFRKASRGSVRTAKFQSPKKDRGSHLVGLVLRRA